MGDIVAGLAGQGVVVEIVSVPSECRSRRKPGDCVTVASSTEITATFTPNNSTTAGGNQGVTVTVAGPTSNSQNFFVQYPKHLAYIDTPTTPTTATARLLPGPA